VNHNYFAECRYRQSPFAPVRYSALPSSIVAADDYLRQSTPEAQAIVDSFVQTLKDKLDLEVQHIDLGETMAERGWDGEKLKAMRSDYRYATAWCVPSDSPLAWLMDGPRTR
jgi:hypothetical protein